MILRNATDNFHLKSLSLKKKKEKASLYCDYAAFKAVKSTNNVCVCVFFYFIFFFYFIVNLHSTNFILATSEM